MSWRVAGRCVGLLFILAAVSKGIDPTVLVVRLKALGPGHFAASLAAAVVVAVEGAAGYWVLVSRDGKWSSSALGALVALYSAFLVYVGLSQGWRTDCGCGEIVGTLLPGARTAVAGLIRNSVLLALLAGDVWRSARPGPTSTGPTLSDLVRVLDGPGPKAVVERLRRISRHLETELVRQLTPLLPGSARPQLRRWIGPHPLETVPRKRRIARSITPAATRLCALVERALLVLLGV